MTRTTLAILAFLAMAPMGGTSLEAQDLTGDWQGALKAGTQELRLVLHLEKADAVGWKATLASIDQSPDRGVTMLADSVTVKGSAIALTFSALRGSYAGTIASDGNSISGTWTQIQPLPLDLKRATPDTAWKDPSPHTVQLITADQNVQLEVLDWGGPPSGQPRSLVLLAGLGNTAHIFDRFAPALTTRYRVLGITRRGFGASSSPAAGYSADRLGDDVLAVLDALKITKPVLAGHSLGGEELSSIGSRHPAKVAGLIYLDAGYGYAFHDPTLGSDINIASPTELAVQGVPVPPVIQGIFQGMQKYTTIPVPILAIYALPHRPAPAFGGDPAARAAQQAREEERAEAQARAFEKGLSSARVVRIPQADHYVFQSHESDVLREMQAFIGALK
jgi:pimeloyl-ACP methyl ester carboxylesterase